MTFKNLDFKWQQSFASFRRYQPCSFIWAQTWCLDFASLIICLWLARPILGAGRHSFHCKIGPVI